MLMFCFRYIAFVLDMGGITFTNTEANVTYIVYSYILIGFWQGRLQWQHKLIKALDELDSVTPVT